MKKYLSLLLVITLVFCVSFSIAESASSITIDLTSATDEELEAARSAIVQEQKSRIVTKLLLDETSIELTKGSSKKITASIEGLQDDTTASKYTWSSSDEKVVNVKDGNVRGIGAGEATVTCSCILSNGIEINTSCAVSVIIPINAISFASKNVTANIGETFKQEPKVIPEDATNKNLLFESSNNEIATIGSDSSINIIAAGTVEITATSQDGSNKSASYSITIPSLSAPESFTVESKSGDGFEVKYYGISPESVSVSCKNTRIATVESTYYSSDKSFWLYVEPISAGKTQIIIKDGNDKTNQRTVDLIISDNAIYSKKSYPSIKYTDAFRYPENYKGENVSFSGRVLQVVRTGKYRISSKGRYKNVVYVTISSSNITTPILEDDTVTVYGTYDGTYTYETVLGASVTIPEINAEKIVVK